MKIESLKSTRNNSIPNISTSKGNNEELIAQRTADLMPTVATNLRKLIETQGISQKVLSEQTGYSEAAISKYITAKQFPQLDFFFELKKLYDISIDDFLSKEISQNDMKQTSSLSVVEQEEQALYRKYCGTYLLYYLNTSSYKGRDNNSPEEALTYGIIHIYETKTNLDKSDYSSIAVLGIKDRNIATELKKKFESFTTHTDIEQFIKDDTNDTFSNKVYYGDFEFSTNYASILISHNRKDKALIILHRVDTNKKEYIGGIGTINSVSKGREGTPTAQYIALSRYPISLSAEEIHHHLLLGHPTYKADNDAKSLIALFKKLYINSEEAFENMTEHEKYLMIKVNLEKYIKDSLKRNMFRSAKISNLDDEAWYKLLKEVSIFESDNELKDKTSTI